MKDFRHSAWRDLAEETTSSDGVTAPTSFASDFADAMHKVFLAKDCLLSCGANPSKPMDKTWVRSFGYYKGVYSMMLYGMDTNYAWRMLDTFEAIGA